MIYLYNLNKGMNEWQCGQGSVGSKHYFTAFLKNSES